MDGEVVPLEQLVEAFTLPYRGKERKKERKVWWKEFPLKQWPIPMEVTNNERKEYAIALAESSGKATPR